METRLSGFPNGSLPYWGGKGGVCQLVIIGEYYFKCIKAGNGEWASSQRAPEVIPDEDFFLAIIQKIEATMPGHFVTGLPANVSFYKKDDIVVRC